MSNKEFWLDDYHILEFLRDSRKVKCPRDGILRQDKDFWKE
jgi:hypothetical protein